MFKLIKVTGESLSPDYLEGDYVLITWLPFFLDNIRVGDTIVFRHPEYGTLIKRVAEISSDRSAYFVIGSHQNSLDSRHFGPLSRGQLYGKVIWHIKKPRL